MHFAKTLIFNLLLILFTSFPVYAQEFAIKNPDSKFNIGSGTDDHINLIDPTSNPVKTSINSSLNINLDKLGLPKSSTCEWWNSYAHSPNVYYIDKYEGFIGVIHSQIERFAMRYYNNYFDEYAKNQDNPIKFCDRIDLIYSDFANPCRWWEHDLNDLRPIEKGGARFEYNTIGHEIDIFSLYGLTVNNTGKISINEMDFAFAFQAETEALKNSDNKNNRISYNIEELDWTKKAPTIGFKFFKNLLKNEYFEASGNIKFNLRVDQFDMNNKSAIIVASKIRFLYKQKPWLDFNIKATARPLVQDYALEFNFQFLTF